MLSEIGSNFWIHPSDLEGEANLGTPEQFGLRGSDFVWLSTGRSATRLVMDTIEAKTPTIDKVAVIPPFTCHTVIEPFKEKEYKLFTYPINLDLSSNAKDILRVVEGTRAKVLLIHRYFGFDTIPDFDDLSHVLREKGISIIEDCTQCLYSSFKKSDADYFVGSIRKWCGVPDGGFAVCREGEFIDKPLRQDNELQTAKYEAAMLKYKYMFCGEQCKPESKKKYREAESILDEQIGYYRISALSSLVQTNLDYSILISKRRANFMFLAENINGIKGISLPLNIKDDDTVPLYLPIWVQDRECLQSKLADNDIYAPIVWPKADCCPTIDNNAESLYTHLLCIPIDQRYDLDDMQRILNVLKD